MEIISVDTIAEVARKAIQDYLNNAVANPSIQVGSIRDKDDSPFIAVEHFKTETEPIDSFDESMSLAWKFRIFTFLIAAQLSEIDAVAYCTALNTNMPYLLTQDNNGLIFLYPKEQEFDNHKAASSSLRIIATTMEVMANKC